MVYRTISIGLIAGMLAGLCLFLVERSLTLPLIEKAETFETATGKESASDSLRSEPMRSLSTLLGDVFVGTGFGLILTGIFTLSGKEGWLSGLLLGIAGFAVFHVAPALIVPPAVPGMVEAPLLLRQMGWLSAVASAIVGLALVYGARGLARLAGILVLAMPLTLFRMLVPLFCATAPSHELAAIERIFIVRTLVSALIFWLILGITSGYLFARGRRNATLF
jgi:cobalt transporter subunit CbtA